MDSSISPLQQMISSCSGAVITSLFVTPLDVVKIRMQSQKSNRKCFLYCNGLMDHMCYCTNGNGGVNLSLTKPTNGPMSSGTIRTMMHIARFEGVSSLWSGLSPTLLMAVPATVMYFTSYDQLKPRISRLFQLKTDNLFVPVLSGGLARCVTVAVVSPIELIRTKMQSKKLSYQELGSVIRQSVKLGGVQSLYIGMWSTLLRDVPFSMLYWTLYEQFKANLYMSSLFCKSFVSGFSAGMISAVVTIPFDVIKTKKQILLGLRGTAPTMSSITYEILKDNGVRGLFAGIGPRCMKVAPACAIMISSYELGKRFFGSYNETQQAAALPNKRL